jgi:peptide/nickel transport system substrate-binding protein
MIRTALGVALAIAVAGAASAQTLNMMKGIDAPHYDAQRTTWGPTSDIVNMFQDTLVALDWDGRTPVPYLAKSWTISEDGRTYTFKLRDDVSFCSGKKFTAEDVVYSFKRLKDPAIKGPYAWRAGNIKELRATDPYTVEYELEEPFSELLLQLTMFTNVIHNRESVEALGKDYGIKGADGTGPWCFESWQPRTEIVLKRHDAYKWGPSMYKNKGPVKFEKLVIKIIPEDSSRVAAMMAGKFDVTHMFPAPFITQAKAAPMLTVTEAKPNFQLLYFGFKTTRPMVADKRVREAMSIAINRAEIAKGIFFGNADPAYTFVDPEAPDFATATKGIIKEDIELAKKLLPKGAGAVFSFDIKGGRPAGRAFIEALRVFSHLANVGDAKSLVIHPATTTHYRMSDEDLKRSGIAAGTVRLSIGLEDPQDLIDDLERSLKAASRA